MHSSSILASVAFVVVLAALVAVVDGWRESRAIRRPRVIATGRGTATARRVVSPDSRQRRDRRVA